MNKNIKVLHDKLENKITINEQIEILCSLSREYCVINDLKKSEKYYLKAIAKFKNIDNPLLEADLYFTHSNYLFKIFDINQALSLAYKALQIFRVQKQNKKLSRVTNLIGVIYSSLELTDKAIEFYEASIKYDPLNVAPVQNISQKYLINKNIPKSEFYIKKSIDMAKSMEKSQHQDNYLVQSYLIYAEILSEDCRFDEAFSYYNKTEKILETTQDKRGIAFLNLGRGTLYLKNEEYNLSESMFLKAKDISEDINSVELKWFSNSCLKSLYKKLNNYQKLSEILELLLELRVEIQKKKYSNRIKELETAYTIQRKELEYKQLLEKSQRLASIGVMAAGVTHEINQPLNSISINAQMILFKNKKENILPKDYEDCIIEISSGIERINNIINHMRTFWNYPDYKVSEVSNINEIIISSVDLINQQISSHGITLNLNLCKETVLAKIHKIHLEQIMINLIVNSLHSLDDSNREDKNIMIKTKLKNGKCIITIKDNGVGFKDAISDEIYEPFYSTKTPDKGMGLGLAIVKTYIEKMGGEIVHGNNSDIGAFFEITIKIAKNTK